jgi:hypothetical protein
MGRMNQINKVSFLFFLTMRHNPRNALMNRLEQQKQKQNKKQFRVTENTKQKSETTLMFVEQRNHIISVSLHVAGFPLYRTLPFANIEITK